MLGQTLNSLWHSLQATKTEVIGLNAFPILLRPAHPVEQ
jgi:hypothetical protein